MNDGSVTIMAWASKICAYSSPMERLTLCLRSRSSSRVFSSAALKRPTSSATSYASLGFVEFRVDQLLQRGDGLGLVRTVRFHGDDRAAAGGQEEDAED